MAIVRVAVIQLTCHPSFTIGGRDYSSEPFLDSGEPILSRLSKSMDVAPIRTACATEYRHFHDLRVASVLDWIAGEWSLYSQEQPNSENEHSKELDERDVETEPLHLIVFPEGSIPHDQVRKIMVPFVQKCAKYVTILAGTHALHASKEFLSSYPEHVHHHKRNPFLQNKKGSEKPWHELTPEEIQAARMEELCRIIEDRGYDSKSVLPIVHHNASVSLRLKEMASPFERTNNAHRRARRNSSHKHLRVPRYFNSLDIHYPYPSSPQTPRRSNLKILPLVCSEALQLPDAVEQADVVAILGYHGRPQDFKALIEQARLNGKLVVLANDGAFGGSGVFLTPDNRAENWWFAGSNNGALPAGDGVLLVDVDTQHIAPQVGQNNPHYPNGLVAIAAVVPDVARSSASRIADTLQSIDNIAQGHLSQIQQGESIGIDYEKLLDSVRPLVESSRATPVQRLKLWRIRELMQLHNLTQADSGVLCKDIRIQRQLETISFSPDIKPSNSLSAEYSLQELESRLSWEVLQFIEHETSLANEKGMLHDAHDLVDVKRRLEERRGVTTASSPLNNIFRILATLRAESVEAAKSRIARRLGKIVERAGATSGWVFLIKQGSPARFLPVAAYNAPELHIDRTVAETGSGIVGHVAFTGMPYIANNIQHTAHRRLYLPDVASTRSELAVPVKWRDEVIAVLNVEANFTNAFTPFAAIDVSNEAHRMISDVLILAEAHLSENAAQWHPSRHGWQLTPYLDRVCSEIAGALPTLHGSPSVGCSIWCLDAVKEVVSVIGTARFDYEYVSERVLSVQDSHIGRAILAMLKEKASYRSEIVQRGTLLDNLVEDLNQPSAYFEECRLLADLPDFKRRRKAQRMELRSISVFPFVVKSAWDGVPSVACALAIYGFDHEWGIRGVSLPQMFTPTAGHNLVAELSSLIHRFFQQKTQSGIAYLIGRLRTDATSSRNPLETLKQVLQRVFAAHGATIFVRPELASPPGSDDSVGQLTLVATTGVTVSGPNASPDWRTYPLERIDLCKRSTRSVCRGTPPKRLDFIIGLTNFLGQSAGSVVRKNDAVDIEEAVSTSITGENRSYIAPRNTLVESFAPGASEHMRFLGSAVTEHSETGSRVVGVVRLTRTGSAPPFHFFDEAILSTICVECVSLFADRSDQIGVNLNSRELTSTIQMSDNNPFAKLGMAISSRYGVPYHDALAGALVPLVTFLKAMESSEPQDTISEHLREAFASVRVGGKMRKLSEDGGATLGGFLKGIKDVFGQWRAAASLSDATALRRRLLLRQHAFSVGGVAVNAVLEDLNALCYTHLGSSSRPDGNPTVLSSLRCVVSHSDYDFDQTPTDVLRIVAVQPAWNSEKPDEDNLVGLPRPKHQRANGWRCIERQMPIFFWIENPPPPQDAFHYVHRLSEVVTSGICIPFQFSLSHELSGNGDMVAIEGKPLTCILSVDFACGRSELSDEVLANAIFPSAWLAVSKLRSMFEMNGAVARTHPYDNSEASVLERYDAWVNTKFTPGDVQIADGVHLCFWKSANQTMRQTIDLS